MTSPDLQRSAEADDPLDFFESDAPVGGNAVCVVHLGVAGDFSVAHFTRAGFGGLDERSSDPAALPRWFDIPAIDEWDRRRAARGRVRPEIQFEEADDAPLHLGDEYQKRRRSKCEIFPCLHLMVGERTGPEGLAQAHPVGLICVPDFTNGHRCRSIITDGCH
jgi:hypothetical protein